VAPASPARLRTLVVSERGFTLIELLVYILCAVVVFGAITTALISSIHAQSTSSNRGQTLEEVDTALATMTKDIREASAVTSANTRALSLTMPDARTIVYDCTVADTRGTRCQRSVNAGQGRAVLHSVANTDVFGVRCRDVNGNIQACGVGATPSVVQVLLRSELACGGQGNAATTCPRFSAGDASYPCPWANSLVSPCPRRTVSVRDDVRLRNAS
jgi:Tfp pilus assembly protein PilW